MKAKLKKNIATLNGIEVKKGSLVEVEKQKDGTYTIYNNGSKLMIEVHPSKLKILE